MDEDDEDDHDDVDDDDDMGVRNNVCHAATFQNASTTPVWHHYLLQISKTGCGRRDDGGPRKIAKVIYSQWRLSTSTWGREITL